MTANAVEFGYFSALASCVGAGGYRRYVRARAQREARACGVACNMRP